MKNSKLILSFARIWGFMSLVFLSLFLTAHIFGEETILFNNKTEMVAFLFFPMGIVFGLFVAYRSAMTGGLISLVSLLVISFLMPDLIFNLYFLFSVIPGILFLIYGILKKTELANK